MTAEARQIAAHLAGMDPAGRSLGDVTPGSSGLRRFHQAIVSRCLAVGLRLSPRDRWHRAQAHAEMDGGTKYWRHRVGVLIELEWMLSEIGRCLRGSGWRFGTLEDSSEWGFWREAALLPREKQREEIAIAELDEGLPPALQVACPFCDSAIGEPCQTKVKLNRRSYPHLQREYAYTDRKLRKAENVVKERVVREVLG